MSALNPEVSVLGTFAEALAAERIRVDTDSLSVWGRDRTTSFPSNPRAILFPETTAEVAAIVRSANAGGFALVPSGGRTGLSGGAVARTGEVVVSLDRMNRVERFNPTDRLLTCQAGVITQVVQETAQAQGLFYPVDFASAGSSHIGGNVATNAGGIRVIRYGLTRQWIAGLTVVTGTGEVLHLNHGLIKNATGYDLRHLFIGSEGTLGIITEVDVRLCMQAEPQRVLVLAVPLLSGLMQILAAFSARIELSAFEFFSDLAMRRVIARGRGVRPFTEASSESPLYALLEFDESAEEEALRIFESLLEVNVVTDGVISRSDAQAKALWALRENISECLAPERPYKNDISVRIEDVPDFLTSIDLLVSRRYPDFEVCWYGHIGDGNLHLNILKPPSLDEAEFVAVCHHISPELFAEVRKRGGSISAEHGVGLLKREFLGFSRSAQEVAAMRAIKAVFDPNGVLNPGKLL
jgi:FAD/FMN-containing dehydrogenase